jgi:hypothetical protein
VSEPGGDIFERFDRRKAEAARRAEARLRLLQVPMGICAAGAGIYFFVEKQKAVGGPLGLARAAARLDVDACRYLVLSIALAAWGAFAIWTAFRPSRPISSLAAVASSVAFMAFFFPSVSWP